jgi:hypothetical protein
LMMSILWINDVDIEALGCAVSRLEGWGAAIQLSAQESPLPSRYGAWVAPESVSAPSRSVQFSLLLSSADIPSRDALLSRISALCTGWVELRFGDSPTHVLAGLVTTLQSRGEASLSFVEPDLILDVTVTCPDPAKVDRYVQNATIGTVNLPVPCGNLPHEGVLHICGAATNPALFLNDVEVMSFTVTLAAHEALEVDLTLRQVRKRNASTGVVTNALGTWASGDFFSLDPALLPRLRMTGATYGRLDYRRRWSN